MVDMNKIILASVGTMVSAILSVIVAFVVLIFLPLLNDSAFLSASARSIIEDVYPIIIVLLPLFTFIGGLVVTLSVLRG